MVQRYDFMFGTLGQCEHPEGDFVKYDDYAALEKERNALKRLIQMAYDAPISDEGMHWVNQAVNNLDAWLDK
ncbi:TPA: hypothetical protein ACXHW4_004190 [Enterobacter hormaechei]